MKFLRRLLPILSPSYVPPQNDNVITKVMSDLDHFLPFRQHAPSLANARRHIYAELDGLSSDDGVGFFNILAFRGVFFGSPFARSNQFRWFDSLEDWEGFRNNHHEANQYRGEEYYVVKHCYGQSQAGRQLSLLSSYWTLRNKWNDTFNKSDKSDKSKKPTVTNVFRFLTSNSTNSNKTLFPNIGKLTALLICGDLVEAGILPMPSTKDWAESINKMGKGSKAGMESCKLVNKGCSREEFCSAFSLLDEAIQMEFTEEEKKVMGYNVVMLEHTLCKINRIGVELF